ncbi:hypothetical protein ILYODFUR_037996, partial [Ilyodon furcidens]
RTVTTLDQKIEKIRKKRKAEEKLSQSCEPEGSSEMKEEEEGEEDPAERKEEDEDEEEEDGDEEEFGSSDEEVLTKSALYQLPRDPKALSTKTSHPPIHPLTVVSYTVATAALTISRHTTTETDTAGIQTGNPPVTG